MDQIKSKLAELYNLAKWKVQTEYIDKLEIENEYKWLMEIDKIFCKIPTDRKDKFYYLIDKLITNINDIDFVCQLTNLKDYIICKNIDKFTSNDIFRYILNNKVYDYDIFNKIEFNLEDVKNVLKNSKVINRDFLSKYLMNKIT